MSRLQSVSRAKFPESIYVCGDGILYLWSTWYFNKTARYRCSCDRVGYSVIEPVTVDLIGAE